MDRFQTYNLISIIKQGFIFNYYAAVCTQIKPIPATRFFSRLIIKLSNNHKKFAEKVNKNQCP